MWYYIFSQFVVENQSLYGYQENFFSSLLNESSASQSSCRNLVQVSNLLSNTVGLLGIPNKVVLRYQAQLWILVFFALQIFENSILQYLS